MQIFLRRKNLFDQNDADDSTMTVMDDQTKWLT